MKALYINEQVDFLLFFHKIDYIVKGGDVSLNPNNTYTEWQWYLVKTAEKKSLEIIT